MEKKKIKKPFLNKRTVTVLNPEEMGRVQGGWTTSFDSCSQGGPCCNSMTGCIASRGTCESAKCDIVATEFCGLQ